MIPFLQNRFLSRRGFFNRAKAAGATGVLTALSIKCASAKAGDTNPWAYDVSRYLTTDPAFVRYVQHSVFESSLPDTRCLTRDETGQLYLGAGSRVAKVGESGAAEFHWKLPGEVRSIAVRDGLLYAALKDHVEVYDARGAPVACWDVVGGKAYLTGIAVGDNDVFLADAGNRVVRRHDRSGKPLNLIGRKDKERDVPGFIVPSPFFSVALGADGLVRATNTGRHRVELYTPEGHLELSWGQPGAAIENFCGCCNPIDLAILPDGRTVTFEKGIPRVKVYSATGGFECVVAGPESFAENARVCGPNECTLGGMDGVVDDTGRVLILDVVTGKVRVMERKPERT